MFLGIGALLCGVFFLREAHESQQGPVKVLQSETWMPHQLPCAGFIVVKVSMANSSRGSVGNFDGDSDRGFIQDHDVAVMPTNFMNASCSSDAYELGRT